MMKLTARGEKVVIGIGLIIAIALGLFFPWEKMPWNTQPYCAEVVYYENGEIMGCGKMVTP